MRKFIAVIFLGLVAVAGSVQAACYNNCKAVPECSKMGYKLENDIFCPEGSIKCPFDPKYIWCKEYTCKDGRYYASAQDVGNEKGYKCDEVSYHGNRCFDCHCQHDPEECQWNQRNKGKGELSDPCCDGTFATCHNTCADTVIVPEHATPLKTKCVACGTTKEITTEWKCIEPYEEYNGGCYLSSRGKV